MTRFYEYLQKSLFAIFVRPCYSLFPSCGDPVNLSEGILIDSEKHQSFQLKHGLSPVRILLLSVPPSRYPAGHCLEKHMNNEMQHSLQMKSSL